MNRIKVNIEFKQEVTYNQEVEITMDEYEAIKDLVNNDIGDFREDEKEAFEIITNYIDFKDVFDAEQIYTDVMVTIPKNHIQLSRNKIKCNN